MAHYWQPHTVHADATVYRYMAHGEPIADLVRGQTVQARAGGTGWQQVLLDDGRMGYVCKQDTALVVNMTPPQNGEAKARSQ